MISIYKRGRIFWARGSVRGQPIRKQSLDTAFRDVALHRARDLESAIDGGLSGVRPTTWRQFAQEFLDWIKPSVAESTLKKYTFIANRFGAFLSDQRQDCLLNIHPPSIAEFIGNRMQEIHPKHRTTPAPGGLRSDLRILRRIFNYAKANNYIFDNPVKQPRLNHFSTVTLPFTDDELSLMFADPDVKAKPKIRAVLYTLLYTGMRISDVAGLQRSSVHLDTGTLELKAKKNKSILVLPIHAELRPVLIAHLASVNKAQEKSPFVFSTEKGLFDHSLEAKLRRVWKRCGIQNAHAHRFRDTFSVKLLAQGASLYDVAHLLGNSVRVTERHYAPYVKELQERGARLVNAIKIKPKDVRDIPADPMPTTLPMPALKQ